MTTQNPLYSKKITKNERLGYVMRTNSHYAAYKLYCETDNLDPIPDDVRVESMSLDHCRVDIYVYPKSRLGVLIQHSNNGMMGGYGMTNRRELYHDICEGLPLTRALRRRVRLFCRMV